MNENEFELDGKVYVAVHGGGCSTCCFNNHKSIEKCASMTCISDDASYMEKDAPHSHVSAQCDKYAEEEGRKQALDDEIERVADDLLWRLPGWVITDETYMLALTEAERIVKLKIRGIE